MTPEPRIVIHMPERAGSRPEAAALVAAHAVSGAVVELDCTDASSLAPSYIDEVVARLILQGADRAVVRSPTSYMWDFFARSANDRGLAMACIRATPHVPDLPTERPDVLTVPRFVGRVAARCALFGVFAIASSLLPHVGQDEWRRFPVVLTYCAAWFAVSVLMVLGVIEDASRLLSRLAPGGGVSGGDQ